MAVVALTMLIITLVQQHGKDLLLKVLMHITNGVHNNSQTCRKNSSNINNGFSTLEYEFAIFHFLIVNYQVAPLSIFEQ